MGSTLNCLEGYQIFVNTFGWILKFVLNVGTSKLYEAFNGKHLPNSLETNIKLKGGKKL